MIKRANLKELLALHERGELQGVFETSNEDYHAAPGISNTLLTAFSQAPAVYDFIRSHPPEPTDAMIEGSLLHCLVLEPAEFSKRYAVAPETVTHKGSKEWKDFVKANQDKICLKVAGSGQYSDAKEIADAARKHARVGLLEGRKELSFWWKDPVTGLLCKCRPDNLHAKGIAVDYKTAESVYPDRVWSQSLYRFRYHVQAALMLDGIPHALEQAGQSLGETPVPTSFVHYAQEKSAPFLVKPWSLNPATIDLGRREYRECLDGIAECEKKGVWPGYPEKIEGIDAPEYAWKDELNDE